MERMITKESADFSAAGANELLICEDNFAYFSPCEQLKTLISNFTVTFPEKGVVSEDYKIVPHGSATLVFTYDGSTDWSNLRGLLFGPSSRPYAVGKSANECSVIFIIEFQPAGLFVFTGTRQNELTDKIIPFEMIDPLLDSAVKEIFREAVTAEELLGGIENLLLLSRRNRYPEEFSLAVRLIIEHCGNISPKEIAEKTFYSERHLNRLFNQYLGLNIKHFSRIVRINRTIHLLHHAKYSISYISEESGFYDISHYIRDFKAVCGITPQEYRANMSDFYSEIAKF